MKHWTCLAMLKGLSSSEPYCGMRGIGRRGTEKGKKK